MEQEKSYQARKDKEHSRRLEKVRAELLKLKSFGLMLVDERQLHMEQIHQQSQKIQELVHKLQEKEQRLASLTNAAKDDSRKVLKLQAELEHKTETFARGHEEMAAKLAHQESESRQLRLKLAGLVNKMEELEESNKSLTRSEEDLRELREKISKGEWGSSSLMAELQNLRKRVLEMEGKDEEITKTESQCRELRKKLQDEENRSKELRLEVDKQHKRMADLEKLESTFTRSRAEVSQLHVNLDQEKRAVKDLACELEKVRTRLKELESSESTFEKSELRLKDDLMQLKSFTVILAEERKNVAERLKREEQKSDVLDKMLKTEEGKVTEVTERLIEESKKLLRFKSDMEVKVTSLSREKEELKSSLAAEVEQSQQLRIRVEEGGNNTGEDNKVKELTLEIERLKSRLKQLEVVEGDLMKTEDQYDVLEKKFRMEQDKANALCKLLEDMKCQITRNKAMEKGEVRSQEAELRSRCRVEETKSRELQAEVQALKEKIHDLMNKEDQLSQLQVDFSVLQQRFIEEEENKRTMSQEVDHLTKELEATKRYSRALRPGMNGRRMVDVPVTSTAVQTDAEASESAEHETAAGFIRKSVLEENHLMSNLRQRDLKKPVLERYPPASTDLARKSWIPWMKKKEAMAPSQTPEKTNRSSAFRPPERPGQPLHIRVTPDHENSTATLEITSPRAEDFFSSTTIIPTLGLQKPRITIVPKPTTAPQSKGCDAKAGRSPVSITTISRAKSPESLPSPVSIITVSTTPVAEACASSEPHDVPAGRTVIRMSPEQQPGPPPVRHYSSNSSIITTEDNKIHIHLGSQFKRPSEGSSSSTLTLGVIDPSTGTVLRSPRHPPPGKMTSSIMITPVTSAASRPAQSVVSSSVCLQRVLTFSSVSGSKHNRSDFDKLPNN